MGLKKPFLHRSNNLHAKTNDCLVSEMTRVSKQDWQTEKQVAQAALRIPMEIRAPRKDHSVPSYSPLGRCQKLLKPFNLYKGARKYGFTMNNPIITQMNVDMV